MTLANAADSGTTYTGCLKAGVIFNVAIGSEPRASCSKVAATKVSWNQSGPQGLPGVDGKSAYQVWLDQGNTGTPQDFLNSLKGRYGTDSTNGTNGVSTLIRTTAESSGSNCANGGQKVETGRDDGAGGGTVGDGVLQARRFRPRRTRATARTAPVRACSPAMGSLGVASVTPASSTRTSTQASRTARRPPPGRRTASTARAFPTPGSTGRAAT